LLSALDIYKSAFPQAMLGRMRAKLGLSSEHEGDLELTDDWLKLMAAGRVDFTIAFRRLGSFSTQGSSEALRDLFLDREAFDAWTLRYRARLLTEASVDAERAERMRRVNPAVVLRNHLAEGAIRTAQQGDFGEVQRLLKVLSHPFDEPELASDAAFPPDWAQDLEVSCSS